MPRHHLLEQQGIHRGRVERITRTEDRTVRIELRTPFEGRCPACGVRTRRRKTSGTRVLQGLGTHGARVVVEIPWVDFRCEGERCERTTFRGTPDRDLEGVGGLLPAVEDVVRRLVFAHASNHKEVVRLLKDLHAVTTTEATVRRIVKATPIRTPRGYAPRHLGIDERYPKGIRRRGRRRRKAAVELVLFDLELGRVIVSVRGKDGRAARRLFLKAKKRADLRAVETITRDLCDHWDDEIHEALDRDGKRVVVRVDDFHLARAVMRHVYEKGFVVERQRLRREGRLRDAAALFRMRYAFRKRRRKLQDEDQRFGTARARRLDELLVRHPRLARLYRLKERFLGLLRADASCFSFDKRLIALVKAAERLGLKEFAGTLARHSEFVLNAKLFAGGRHLPEPCFARYRAAERRRRSFRTARSRALWERAQLKSAILLQREAG